MADQLILPSGDVVKKSNALCRARWTVESIWEPRLVALLASKVRTTDKDFQTYEIHVSEILQRDGGNDYKEIEAVVDRVMSRVLTVYDDAGWTKYNVFARCRFRRADGMLELGFHPDLKQHYLQLQKNFAQYDLLEFLMLPSIYSQRIFEILKSYNDLPEVTLNLKELQEMMDVPDSLKKDFAQFRRRVLEKAHKDICNTSPNLSYEWEPVKKGRAVIAIRFIFNKKAVAKVAEQKKSKEIARRTKNNNVLFRQAMWCAQGKGEKGCVKKTQPSDVCDVCQKLKMLSSFAVKPV